MLRESNDVKNAVGMNRWFKERIGFSASDLWSLTMANVKKQAKNTAKGKTDEQITQSVSQTPVRSYKKRIIFFSILSPICLTLAFIPELTLIFGWLAFSFAWMATAMTFVTIFPKLKTNKIKTFNFGTATQVHTKDGKAIDQYGIKSDPGNQLY